MKQRILHATFCLASAVLSHGAHATEPAAGTSAAAQGRGPGCDTTMAAMKGMEGMKTDCAKPGAAMSDRISTGEVREIDGVGKAVTLRHGPIKNMHMPAMTMSFGVADAAMLHPLKVGDKVNFTVENVGSAPTVTMIKKQ